MIIESETWVGVEIRSFYRKDGIRRDSIELDPKYANIFEHINEEVDEILKDPPLRGQLGFIHLFWDTKQKHLKDKYNIHWRTPGDLNPETDFD